MLFSLLYKQFCPRREQANEIKLRLAFGPSRGRTTGQRRGLHAAFRRRGQSHRDQDQLGMLWSGEKSPLFFYAISVGDPFTAICAHLQGQRRNLPATINSIVETPMNTTACVKIAALLFMAVSAARADAATAFNYPWCANYMMQNGPKNCGFTTLAQCWQTVSGIGGYCAANPAYVPAKPTTGKRNRAT